MSCTTSIDTDTLSQNGWVWHSPFFLRPRAFSWGTCACGLACGTKVAGVHMQVNTRDDVNIAFKCCLNAHELS